MVQWRRKRRIVQLIWNTFFIFAFLFLFSAWAPIKMIFFHVCYNQRVQGNVLLLQIESRMCSCCHILPFSLVAFHPRQAHNGLELHIGSISLEHFTPLDHLSLRLSCDAFSQAQAGKCWWIILSLFSLVQNRRTRCRGSARRLRKRKESAKCCVMINSERAKGYHHYGP